VSYHPTAGVSYHPTAVHAVAAVHDTALSREPLAWGMGTDCLAHRVPFQASAPAVMPSAVQAVLDGHDTATSGPPVGVV